MKKRITFVIVIILILFLVSFVIYRNNTNERKETIALVDKIFEINIQDYEFEYENKLEKNKYDGFLTVKLNLNSAQLKEFLNKWDISETGFKLSTWEDDIIAVSNRLGLDAKEGKIYSRLSGVKRKIWFVDKPKTIFSFVYFLENDDSSTTVYMGYVE